MVAVLKQMLRDACVLYRVVIYERRCALALCSVLVAMQHDWILQRRGVENQDECHLDQPEKHNNQDDNEDYV